MSARALYHMDVSDTIIYVYQNAQTVPGKGKTTPVGIPCVRPQSDMRCYMLDRCDLGSGSRHYLILAWFLREKQKHKGHKACEQNKNRGIPIFVEEERWDANRGIPKLRCLSIL